MQPPSASFDALIDIIVEVIVREVEREVERQKTGPGDAGKRRPLGAEHLRNDLMDIHDKNGLAGERCLGRATSP